jgi:hypothetical protein
MRIVMFVDDGPSLEIPCSSALDDEALIKHLQSFYCLTRMGGGLFEFLGARSGHRIDVVEVMFEQHDVLMLPNLNSCSSS